MALANLAAYLSAIAAPHQTAALSKSISIGNTALSFTSPMYSAWLSAPNAGAAPTAAATCDATTPGALGQFNAASELRMWVEAIDSNSSLQGVHGTVLFCDRLVHMGGLNATLTTAQTVSTVAVPRYTPATDRLFAALEIYSGIGNTLTTLSASYTNQSATAGQTSQSIQFGGSNTRAAVGAFCPMSLASGDLGFSSVETVTLAASTTAAGNFGVTIYKPLLAIPIVAFLEDDFRYDPLTRLGGLMPKIENGACIWPVFIPTWGAGVTTQNINANIKFFED